MPPSTAELTRSARVAPPPARRHGRTALQAVLMRHARCGSANPDLPTLGLAGVLAFAWSRSGMGQAPLAGIDASETRVLLDRYFPGADAALVIDWAAMSCAPAADRNDEIADVIALLLDGAAAAPAETRWLAHAVGTACLGDDHLWQDMGLPSRDVLSLLLRTYFPFVALRNTGNMKWKKFFYKLLCEREGLRVCRAPSCEVCTDKAACFGPEQ